MNGSSLELGLTTHAHPSLSEVLMELGLKVEGRAIHVVGGKIMIDYKSAGLTERPQNDV